MIASSVFLVATSPVPAYAQQYQVSGCDQPSPGTFEPFADVGLFSTAGCNWGLGVKHPGGSADWGGDGAVYAGGGIKPMAFASSHASISCDQYECIREAPPFEHRFTTTIGSWDLGDIAWPYKIVRKDGQILDPNESIPMIAAYAMDLSPSGEEATAGGTSAQGTVMLRLGLSGKVIASAVCAKGIPAGSKACPDSPVGTLSFTVTGSQADNLIVQVVAFTQTIARGMVCPGGAMDPCVFVSSSTKAQAVVDPFLFIDPASPLADELEVLCLKSEESGEFVPCDRTPLVRSGTPVAWGSNNTGQLGDGSLTDESTPTTVSDLTDVQAISGGAEHSLALKSDGTVWAWGSNSHGQLGDGRTTSKTTPIQVKEFKGQNVPLGFFGGVRAIDAGIQYSLALKSDGTVWSWGRGELSQLGRTSGFREFPGQVEDPSDPTGFLTDVAAIAAGGFHGLALKHDGTVWAWGHNTAGQVGDGFFGTDRVHPRQVKDPSDPTGFLTGVVAIAAGSGHSLALKSDGTVRAWGYNDHGQLGFGALFVPPLNRIFSPNPVQVKDPADPSGFLTQVVALAAGKTHSLALKSNRTVWAWGANDFGQLGLAGTDSTTPLPVSDFTDPSGLLSDVAAIAAGGDHNLALKSDVGVWAWGRNDNGQLGNGCTISVDCTSSDSPVQVSGLSGAVVIAAGGAVNHHSLAITEDTDGDGITNPVDGEFVNGALVDQSTVSSDSFTDQHLGGTSFGSIVDRGSLVVTVREAMPNPFGFLLRATGGAPGTATVNACGFDVFLTDGDATVITCSSLTAWVLEGEIKIPLAVNVHVSVPAGATVKITEVTTGQFQVENSGRAGTIVVEFQGQVTELGPGESVSVSEVSLNEPPVADANGPYQGNEGSPITFDGFGSYDPDGTDGTIVLYEWDLDGDGEYDDATGVNPSFTWSDDHTGTIGLKVTDDGGLTDTDSTTVTVNNVAPVVDAGPDVTNYSGQTHQLTATFTDPGLLDTHTATIDWGDSSLEPGIVDNNTVTGSHVYFVSGSYTITVTVLDDDKGVGSDSLVKTVKPLPVQIDIKPGSFPNSINLGNKGNVPVGVFTDIYQGVSFDATTIDRSSLEFAGGPDLGIGESPQDLDADEDLDMVFHFDTQKLNLTATSIQATLTGQTTTGVYFEGSDSVQIVPPKK